ncbi:MAG: hypothetical protein AAF845_05745 [Bacteroidota bacterium]
MSLAAQIPERQLDRGFLTVATRPVSIEVKIEAARLFVEDLLASFDERYAGRIVTHVDRAVTDVDARRERVKIMGDPARYAEVLSADRLGEAAARPLLGGSGEAYATRHAIDVFVYHGLDSRRPSNRNRRPGPEAEDTRAFRALVEGDGLEPEWPGVGLPGLRPALGAQGYLLGPGNIEMTVQEVRTETIRPVFLEDSGGYSEFRHEALVTFTIDG